MLENRNRRMHLSTLLLIGSLVLNGLFFFVATLVLYRIGAEKTAEGFRFYLYNQSVAPYIADIEDREILNAFDGVAFKSLTDDGRWTLLVSQHPDSGHEIINGTVGLFDRELDRNYGPLVLKWP